MNERWKELERQLEQATGATEPDCADLTPETAELREAWNVLRRLLDAASPRGGLPLPASLASRPTPRRNRRRILTAVLLAASLAASVVAAVVWQWVELSGPDGTVAFRDDLPTDTSSTITGEASPVSLPSDDRTANVVSLPSAWDDSFEERLTVLSQQVIRVEQDWASQAVAFAAIESAFDQVRQDVAGDNL